MGSTMFELCDFYISFIFCKNTLNLFIVSRINNYYIILYIYFSVIYLFTYG